MFGQAIEFDVIAEVREVRFEVQLHGTDGAVTLFGDNHFGDVVRHFATLLPLRMPLVEVFGILFGFLRRLRALEIILLAVHEHDHVGVLLDGS